MTTQEIAEQFRTARHHSRAINKVLRETTLTPEHHDELHANIEHLQIMLNEGTWTGIDTTALQESVTLGTQALNPELVGLDPDTDTPEEVNEHYARALDSVSLINSLIEHQTLTDEDFDTLERNVHHLEDILINDYWGDHNLTALNDAVTNGNTKLSNPDSPVNPNNTVS